KSKLAPTLSKPATLSGAPRLTGVDQGDERLARVETQRSAVPILPGRVDWKIISSASVLRRAGRPCTPVEFSSVTTTGLLQAVMGEPVGRVLTTMFRLTPRAPGVPICK